MTKSCSFALLALIALAPLVSAEAAKDPPTYLLQANHKPGATSQVSVRLEVGGDMLVDGEGDKDKKLPLNVAAKATYLEQLIAWYADPEEVVRSLREYQFATADIQVAENTLQRELPEKQQHLLAEIREGRSRLASLTENLTREELDLVNMVGNSLAIDRLLPNRKVAEGESWNHDTATIQALLAMDQVAVCEVSSVATKEEHRQVHIQMAGTVHGLVDGTTAEINLRAAYLFHLDQKRVTKFHMAIQDRRATSDTVPGLDVVAKVYVTVKPVVKSLKVAPEVLQAAPSVDDSLSYTLRFNAPERGFRFNYDLDWFITSDRRDHLSLRYLHEGALTAHCNLTTLPARSAGRHTNLEQFERDVRKSLEGTLENVTAATEWETPQGHHAMAIIAIGTVKKIPVEWRYYLIASDDLPRASLAITLEQAQVEKFADAERQIIDSLELLPTTKATAAKQEDVTTR